MAMVQKAITYHYKYRSQSKLGMIIAQILNILLPFKLTLELKK